MGINVVSLCDGMSCGQISLMELGVDVENYFASEIDKNAIKVTMDNFPKTIQIGDVTKITGEFLKTLPKIDLVLFGSPCRSLTKTTAGRKKYNNGLNGVSWIFYPCNDILQWIKKYNNEDVEFIVENVDSYNVSDLDEISEKTGVKRVLIDSNLFSAQDRKRNYWTTSIIPKLPNENKLVLGDVLEENVDEKFFYFCHHIFHGEDKKVAATIEINGHDILKRVNSKFFKCHTLTACRGGNLQKKVYDKGRCRKLTPMEYRRLQTIPDWYKMNVANSHIYNMCGDGWTIEVIKHIIRGMNIYNK